MVSDAAADSQTDSATDHDYCPITTIARRVLSDKRDYNAHPVSRTH